MEKVSICYDVVAVELLCEERGTQPGVQAFFRITHPIR